MGKELLARVHDDMLIGLNIQRMWLFKKHFDIIIDSQVCGINAL